MDMNILVTLDKFYIPQLTVMLKSLLRNNSECTFNIYVANSSLEKEDFQRINKALNSDRASLIDVKLSEGLLGDAPITDRYPEEMYYRLMADQYLPKTLDRILYLDPDLVVINSLEKLYSSDFEQKLFIATTHVGDALRKFNKYRLAMEEENIYINSGVMLMNLELLRKELRLEDIINYIEEHKNSLWLPDQDIISALYGDRIKLEDALIYNLSDRYLMQYNLKPENLKSPITEEWIRNNVCIIHYCGRNKPWKDSYVGVLDVFYKEYE